MVEAATAAIGNASARLSHLQREKVTKHINEALMPIVQQEENFKDAPPQLFGPDFAKKAKEHVDQMKAMRASLPKKGQKDNFFFFGGGGGGGGGGGATATEATSTLGEEAGAASTTSTGTTKKETTSQASEVGTIRTRTSKQCCKHKIAKRCFTPYTEKKQIVGMGVVPIMAQHKLAGRLAHHLSNWQVLTKDQWVLNTVQGYSLDFISEPHQGAPPHTPQYSSEQHQLIEEEVRALLQKGAVSEIQRGN